MSAGEQEPKLPLDAEAPKSELPTNAFGLKQMDTLPTKLNSDGPSGCSELDAFVPGRLLGQYRILERLGSGGMGHVYKAVHPIMERIVALKIISPRLMQDESTRSRFQREVRNAARLIHPNIVVAYDAAEVGGLWFLVMEYIDGQDVSRLLAKCSRPSVNLACEIVRQAALGLHYAFQCGMVHRDVKPANLMVANARPSAGGSAGWPDVPLVKILDFGLARLIAQDGVGLAGDTVTREGHIVGTPEYMAPEQARNSGSVDIRSDIYALGCTLYSLLAGRPPFRALSTFDLALMHLNEPPEPVIRYCPLVPLELASIVHRMLAKRPEGRFATPGEVASALRPWARPNVLTDSVVVPAVSDGVPLPAAPAVRPQPQQAIAPSRADQEPIIPPGVLMMHFQALLRTIIVFALVVLVGVGCVLYLPDVGNQILSLWNRMTPASHKTPPPPR